MLDPKEANDSSEEEEDSTLPTQSQTGGAEGFEIRTADEDGPTAEDADAAVALAIFLEGNEPDKASPLQLLPLAQSIVPHFWDSVKFDLSKTLLNLVSILFARAVLRGANSRYVSSVPTLSDIEQRYLSFVATIIASVFLPLDGLTTLDNFAPLLGKLVSPDFWLVQVQ
jgi:hypothetical protein